MISQAPAFAQDATPQAAAEPAEDTIVVTGSLLRQIDKQGVSPVTTVTAEDLAVRGITTVQQGVQNLAANNGPALTNGFSANGAFAGGAWPCRCAASPPPRRWCCSTACVPLTIRWPMTARATSSTSTPSPTPSSTASKW
ncbi:hypothetical protein [Sphingobium sp.]|uniref:hypothetical protein n=1 Tax=Sphingobium sp. TaxID=1912891 RepID=UPI002BC2F4C8|nr:hypothetical protein [Sphingobium sp.]HUD95752.1 hypothetical protein [Sphingobium sp.]